MRKEREDAMSKTLLVVDRKDGCDCDLGDFPDEGGVQFYRVGARRLLPCPHGSTARLATAEDVPADLAAEALGLSAEVLERACVGLPKVWSSEHSILSRAALRVREAEQAKGPSDANRW